MKFNKGSRRGSGQANGVVRKSKFRRARVLAPLSLAFVLIAGTMAFADSVQNNVTVGGNDTITAGGSTTISYQINPGQGGGLTDTQPGCNASDGSPATVTINAPAGVIATPNQVVFSACNTNVSSVFSSSTPGNYPITVSVSDPGGGTYYPAPASFTLKVVGPSDTTPPVIVAQPVGTLGDNGWYTSDVGLTWSVTDGQSAVTSSMGCDPASVTADTTGQTFNCTATSSGGTATQSITIKRDATDPTVSATASPAPNGNGWNNSAVTVTFTGNDAMSGIDSCDLAKELTAESADQSAMGSCWDNAGNSATATASDINIDTTDPSVSLVGGPADGSSYYFGSVPAAPTCNATDALSGIDGTCGLSGYSSAIGNHTISATATDKAGNANSDEAFYTVNAWTLNGFFSPVDMGDVLNTVKGGSTVPLKFRVFAGNEITDVAAIKSVSAITVACPNSSTPVLPVEEIAPTGGTVLRYDATGGQFIYNWKTLKNPGKCYKVTMTTMDGSFVYANFKLT